MRTHEMTGILEMLLIQQTDRRLVIDVNEEKPSNMEGCPRSSMLNIDLKDSSPTEFDTQLKKYISEHYQEDPESYKHECQQLEGLRTTCLHPSHDHSGCSVLRRYFAQLQFLQSRFPMIDGGAVSIPFTWTDLYSEESITLSDARFEQAAILHNLGALHSLLGSQEDRTNEEGMKVACTHFQAAAGVFQYLKTTVMVPLSSMKLPWVSEDHFAVPFFDLASCVLQLYINIMLGQAQECLLEKSILDGRKDSLIARISMQVCDYYQQALGILESLGSSYMGSKKAKTWTKAIKIKACHFLCVSYIHMSNHANDNQKFGEKVAYLKAASQKLTEAQKQSKGQPERTLELLQFMADVISNKLEGAVKDNDFIYHEVVPDLTTLPEIKGASLVKPIPFQPCDPSVSGPDIFQRLIPMEAHTDASIYSEEKAKLLRRYNASVDAKNKQLAQSLSSLHIDDLLQPEEADSLPALLKDKHEALRKDAALLAQADKNIQDSSKLSEEIENILKTISSMLEEDEKKETLIREKLGPKPSPPERDEIKKELGKCNENFSKANQTNHELVRVYNAHKQNLELIAGPEERLLAALPSLNIIDSPVDDGAVQRLRDLIAKVEEMKKQRKILEENLRKQLNEDDITGILVTREDGNKMAFFDEQLKKHDGACSLIQANLDAQDRILSALTEANAKYAKTRQAVKENSQRRVEVVQALILSYNTFCELQGKLSGGVQFYQKLSKTVFDLEEKSKNFFDGHGQELNQLMEKIKSTSEPSKPPSRPSAAKPDHLVRPQPSPVPSSMPGPRPPGPMPTSFAEQHQPGTMYHQPGGFPGQIPPGSQGQMVPQGNTRHIPGQEYMVPASQIPGAPSSMEQFVPRQGQHVPGQVPGQAPGQVPGHPLDPVFQKQRIEKGPHGGRMETSPIVPPSSPQDRIYGPRPPSSGHPVPQTHIPADQVIHSTPRMSYPFPVSQDGARIPGQFTPSVTGQGVPRPSSPEMQNQRLPFQHQNQIPTPRSQLPHPANINPALQQFQQIRPEIPGQGPLPQAQRPQQPGMGLQQQMQPRFPGQENIRPQFLPRNQPFPPQMGMQGDPRQQFRQPHPPGSSQQMIFQRPPQPRGMPPTPTSSPMRPPFPQPLQPQLVPRGPPPPSAQLPSPLHPQAISSASTSSSAAQQMFRAQSPMQTGQVPRAMHPQQPPQRDPSQQPEQRFHHPQQQQQLPHQQQQQQQQQQQNYIGQQRPQSFQQQPQQQIFPRPPQPLTPSSMDQPQPYLGQNQNQPFAQHQPFSPQQQQPPFRSDQRPQGQYRPDQQSQQPFRSDQQSQQPFRSDQQSQQPFRSDQQSQGQFRADQKLQQPFRPGQSSQGQYRPDQSQQHPLRPDQPSQGQYRPDQSQQHPLRPDQPSQGQYRPDQSQQQPLRPGQPSQGQFRPEQQSQQPFRPDQTPHGQYRPEQSFQRPPHSEQQPRPPFHPEQQAGENFRPGQQIPRQLPSGQQQQQPGQQQTFQPQQQFQQPLLPGQSSRPEQPPYPFGPDQMKQQPKPPFKQGPFRPEVMPNEPPTQQTSRAGPVSLPGPLEAKQPSQPDGRTRETIPSQQQQAFRMQPQSPQPLTQPTPLPPDQQTNKVMSSHSYPETGAFLSTQPSLSTFPHGYPHPRRPTPSLLQGNQGVRGQGNVTSSDYLTSFSVALAQTQLSQYQSSTSQQHTQEFQQQLLLQQQQLILQQQEMLRQQQTMQTHEHDQAQIGLLLQQILQQQKQMAELEMKVREKSEDVHEHEHGKDSTKTTEVQEQKPKDSSHQVQPSKSLASEEPKTHESTGLPVSTHASTPINLKNTQATKEEKSKSFASSSDKPFLPDYAKMSQFFTNTTTIQDDTKKSGPKDTLDDTAKDHEGETESKKSDVEDSTLPKEDSTIDKPAFGSTRDSAIQKDPQNYKEKSDLSEHKHEVEELTEKEKKENETKKEEESEEEETGKEETSSSSEDPEEVRRREIEEQIKHIKELQQKPENQPPSHGYLYEPGKLPVVVSPDQNEHSPKDESESSKPSDLSNEHEQVPTDETETGKSNTDGPNENEHSPSDKTKPSEIHSHEPSHSEEITNNSELRPTDECRDRKPSFHRQCGHYYETQLSRLGHDTNNTCLNDDESLQALLSTVQGFDNVVKSLAAAKHGTVADGFTIEWKELERLQELDSASMTTHAATMNQAKNRYRDILPWDHTRVKLQSKEESDYINANLLKDITPLTPSFIATQGPIPTTLTDFWMMVWEQQSPLIIMLTKEVEGSRLMCHQYWPIDEGHTVLFGPIRVSLKTLRTTPSWVTRIMHVQSNDSDDTLEVTHLQFTGWPDYGVPASPADLLTFMNEVRSCYKQLEQEDQEKPIIMHCSAGIGRTGTFIVIYAGIEEFHAHNVFVNIPRLVRSLRLQRKYMVQKKEQYEFCYKTLLFYAVQFLDLELSSIAIKRKTFQGEDKQTKEIKASAPYLEDEDEENPEAARKDNVFDEDSKDSRKESSNVRFLGELKSDDSLEGEDLSIKEKKRGENVSNEQSISEKYCQGTLETDNETTKKHGGELKSTERRESEDKRKQTEASTSEPKVDTGIVHIGMGEEVRFSATEDNNSENEDIENESEHDENGGKDSESVDSGLGDHVDKTETQGDHKGTTQSSATEDEKKTDEKTSSENEKHLSDIGGEPKTTEEKNDDSGKNNEIPSNDKDSADKDGTKDDSTLEETDSKSAET